MTNELGQAELERQLADANTRIREMIKEIGRRVGPDVGAVAGVLLGKGSHSVLAKGKANDHPAAGSGSFSGHHAIVLLDESKNEPGSRATPCGLRAADAVVLADKQQMLGSLLRESNIDGPGSIVRERILEGVGEKFVHDDADGNNEIGLQ